MDSAFQLLQRRFGDARPGLQLLAIEDAGIPVTVVRTDVLAQERKQLPLIQEYVLRFVAGGLEDTAQIANLLGLEEDHLLGAAAVQVTENNLRRLGGSRLGLTTQGLEVSRTLAAVQPVLKQLPVVFDRLTWQLVDYTRASLLTKKEALERGLQLLPAEKNARIGLADVTAERFNGLLGAREGHNRRVEILKVRKISPNTHRYMPVQLLVYGDPARQELELAVCIDGALQTEHGLALDSLKAVDLLGLSLGEAESRPLLSEALELQRVGQEAVEQMTAAKSVTDGSLPLQIPDVAKLSVRSLGVFEHAQVLSEALISSRKRILIISPWIKGAVVNTDFLAKLEGRLRNGVEITVAHGYGDDDSGSDQKALRRLENLADRYPARFAFTRLRNTHAKILITDDKWVSTSFNWLSFRGDSDRTYRMEEGTLVQIQSEVDAAYSRYRLLIDEQRV